jgi:cytochrome c biogenesis protein CcdA/thiol-disulfide isomerase/thioredoxin
MEITLLITSYLAGILTVLAPCVLPLLPIIIGGSIGSKNKYQPYIITFSLALSLTIFTILLKASTLLIDIDPIIWKYISGGLVLIFGLTYLFPESWAKLLISLKLSGKSDDLLEKASKQEGVTKSILMGASLGPVFASCSPTYSLILATVLPVNFWNGVVYIVVYSLGLATIMLAIALLGRSFIQKLKVFSNPNGWFRKLLGVIFILVGVFVITGIDKKIETAILDKGFFDITKVEQKILERNMPDSNSKSQTNSKSQSELFNIDKTVKAPEITGITEWINSDPQTIESLKGKVVLVDFWTYSCINCQRTLPYVTKWYDTYKDQGFVVIGVHAPEFSFERNKSNVEKFTVENNVNYPVALDNDFKTWNAYSNRFWPAQYLIDKDGNIRRTHFGEGEYEQTEEAIRILLNEKSVLSSGLPQAVAATVTSPKGENNYCDEANKCYKTTPETYLGYNRAENFANANEFKPDEYNSYVLKNNLRTNQWSLGGEWKIASENIASRGDGAVFKLKFNAKKVYIVLEGEGVAKVTVNGETKNLGNDISIDGELSINGSKLYNVVDAANPLIDGELELIIPAGVSLNAVTFG